MYQKRTLENFLQTASSQFPVILVTGPRQVGKTTILRHISQEERTYVTLDDPILAALAREEPALFLQRFEPPVLIDEIQYAPQLLPHIKMAVDREKRKGMYWLTGSQQFQLMKGITESLAGRVGIVNLLGLSLKELFGNGNAAAPFIPEYSFLKERAKYSEVLSLNEVFRIIWQGAFPAIWFAEEGNVDREGKSVLKFNPVDRDLYYRSYIQTYLQRDVHDLANIGDQSTFLKFLRATAARTGQLLNVSDIARDAATSVTTAKKWLSILEASGIIFLLEPYFSNTVKRLVKTPKLYFLDTGLCAYLTEWSSPETLEAGAMSGAILETFIFNEILKSFWHNGKRAPLYYFRNKDKKEIDLLIIQDDMIYPLEFKKTAAPNKNMVKQFELLPSLNKEVKEGGIICLCEQLLPISKGVNAIPVGLL